MPETAETFTQGYQLAHYLRAEFSSSTGINPPDSVGPVAADAEFQRIASDIGYNSLRITGLTTLLNTRVIRIQHNQKALTLYLSSGNRVRVTFGMTGWFSMKEHRFSRIHFELTDGQFYYNDMRKWGRFVADEPETPLRSVFQVTPESLGSAPGRWTVRELLDNPSYFPGAGNYMINEAMYRAGLHPQRLVSGLSSLELQGLVRVMKELTRESIECRGATLSDYFDFYGQPGTFQLKMRVYRKKECLAGHPVAHLDLGRSTYYCPVCQPMASFGQ